MAKPQKCISVQEAKSLFNNWQTTRANSLIIQGQADAHEFTYSLEELQEFLDYVKEESAKQNVKDPGIRIYFGAYNSEKSKKATVFLAPTKGSETDSDNNYDIDPFNFGTGGWPPNIY